MSPTTHTASILELRHIFLPDFYMDASNTLIIFTAFVGILIDEKSFFIFLLLAGVLVLRCLKLTDVTGVYLRGAGAVLLAEISARGVFASRVNTNRIKARLDVGGHGGN